MMRWFLAAIAMVGAVWFSSTNSFAQGTKLWMQSRYDEMERGTATGVAIRNDGELSVAPQSKLLYTTSGSFVWSIVANPAGDSYLGRGGTTAGSAIITRVLANGTASDIFAGKELAVQALKLDSGILYAATSPDGKVYRIDTTQPVSVARVIFDLSETLEKPKYLWDIALSSRGDVYIAAGAPAVVYKVPANGGKPQVVFKTADQHIRCLLLANDGMLYAGSDGAGIIYRIDPSKSGATPFAVYSAARREITALAADSAGNVYAAGVGTKGVIALPKLPVSGGATGISITFSQPGSSTAATTSSILPEGSEIYKISPDGAPLKLLTLKDDVVYGLTMRNGALLAATGNRGRIYRVDTVVPGRWTDIAHLDATQAMAFSASRDGLLIATSNSGRVFHLADAGSPDATFISAVFDAGIFSQWGRSEVLPANAAFDFFTRTGNVENPTMGWSDWVKASPNTGSVGAPGARYAQWKANLYGTATLDSVGLNYLAKNIAPVVDEVVAQPGARAAIAPVAAVTTVPVNFAVTNSATPTIIFPVDAAATPLIAQRDKTAITVRWSAHDDNGDDLMFAVSYKGEGEANWRLLKDKISDRFFSFDSALLPDGVYVAKVTASDAPVHSDAEALTGEKASGIFIVDTTAPVPGQLTAALEGAEIRVRFSAKDATSPIAHAEYSIDAGPWQYVEPVSKISDSLSENYDFLASVLPATANVTNIKEHVVAIRVYDRYENAVTAKTVVR